LVELCFVSRSLGRAGGGPGAWPGARFTHGAGVVGVLERSSGAE
jgi:hypothetical protein